jgi:hypothetical protein
MIYLLYMKNFKGHYQAAEHIFSESGGEDKLGGETIKESNENFREAVFKVWEKFAVHGISRKNPETGENELLSFTDLDGKSALGLLKLAGFNLGNNNLKYVKPGDYVPGAVNVDTGKKMGVVYDKEERSVFFDHHPENHEDLYKTSATDLVYNTLVKLDLLKKRKFLDRMVDFVNHVDNKSYPDQEKYFQNSHKHILGLSRFLKFDNMLKFFEDGRSPTEELSEEDLRRYGLLYKNNRGKTINRSLEQLDCIESSLNRLKKMEKKGEILESPLYGRIVVDKGGKIKGGLDAVLSFNCNVYIIWGKNGFFISSKNKLADDFVLSEGLKIRGHMYLKADDDKPLKISLDEVLKKMKVESTDSNSNN